MASKTSVPSSKATTYRVQAYRGHIAVFRNEETAPYKELDVNLASLPEGDRALLQKGIIVEDDKTLRSIIEDYES